VTYPYPARAATPRVPEQTFDSAALGPAAAAAAAAAALEAAAAALCNICYNLQLIKNKILTFTINHVIVYMWDTKSVADRTNVRIKIK
jgi:hypothetical protein